MKKILQLQPLDSSLAALTLRLIFGCLFIYHGYDKIEHYHLYLGMFTDIIGIGKTLSFQLLIAAEFGCGILVAIGLFTRLAVIPIAFSMCIAYFVALSKSSFNDKELVLVFMLLSIPIFILGSGRYSADRMFRNK
jgi:putative oxidoreductase